MWDLDSVKIYHVLAADAFRRIPHPDAKYRGGLKSAFPESLMTVSQRWGQAMGYIEGSRAAERPRLSPASPPMVSAFEKIQGWHLDFLFPKRAIDGKLLFWWAYYQLRGTRRKGKNFLSACRREGMNKNQGYYAINSAALTIAGGLETRCEPYPQILERFKAREPADILRVLSG